MTVSVTCPTCNQKYQVEEHLIGEKLRCKKCNTRIVFVKMPEKEQSNAETIANRQTVQDFQANESEENILFVKTPSARAYIGQMIAAGFWSIFLIVAIIVADSFIEPFDFFGFSFLPPLLIGGWTALSIWIDVISTEYKLTDQRLFVKTGLIAKHLEEQELFRIKDVSVNQGLMQRILGFGSITVLSTDDSTPYMVIDGIANPAEVKEVIRTAFRAARKREGVQSTEFIPS